MKKEIFNIGIILLVSLLITIVSISCSSSTEPPPPPPPDEPTMLPTINTDVCDKVQYPIMAPNVDSIYGVELYINYDTSQVIFDSLSSIYLDDVQINVNAVNGVISVVWVDMSLHPFSVTTEDILMTIYFSNLTGTSNISFSNLSDFFNKTGDPIVIRDADNNVINIEDISGSITCGS